MPELPTLVIIRGGEAFDSYEEYLAVIKTWNVRFFEDKTGWKTTFYRELSNRFRILIPDFPCPGNARYEEWEMFFEKFAPNLDPATAVYVGHSLWGIFLAKYFSENALKARELHLIAAPYGRCGTFELVENVANVAKNVSNIHLWHSKDDPVVEFADMGRYAAALPSATTHALNDRGHFNQERFDELAWILKKEV